MYFIDRYRLIHTYHCNVFALCLSVDKAFLRIRYKEEYYVKIKV